MTSCGGRLTSGFGTRSSPGGIGSTHHLGADYAVPIGTALNAMRDGRVVAAGRYGGLGLRIEIDHGNGVHVVYGHLSEITTAVGSPVRRGQVVARSGNTGNSTGPHLHLQIELKGQPIDPRPWLRARGLR